MAIIDVKDLTFSYLTHYENIFEKANFVLDTDWRLGLIGRNGKGKTTLLKLLMGEEEYKGKIITPVTFDYFPFELKEKGETLKVIKNIIAPFNTWERQMEECLSKSDEKALITYGELLEQYIAHDGYIIEELIKKEFDQLQVNEAVLKQPIETLSKGELTKVMLIALFLKKNNFLLIDEPTNHLDTAGRQIVAGYLKKQKGFILVSHDRMFLDEVIDHVLSINRQSIEVQQGNYSSWKMNKDRQDHYELGQNDKLKKEIGRLGHTVRQTVGWSDQIEKSKKGDGSADKGYIGHKSAKMMKRAKSIQKRQKTLIEEKHGLLKDIEKIEALKIHPQQYVKKCMVQGLKLGVSFEGREILRGIDFTINQGERIAIKGPNGCGKSTLLEVILAENPHYIGKLLIGKDLIISYVPQYSSHLNGDMRNYIIGKGIDEPLFKAILRKLDFKRSDFEKKMETLSAGQKKKILIATSLSEKAHLYIWDEPLNYIDVLSREQIEELILEYQPTMVFVEHDQFFVQRVSNKQVDLTPK